MKREYHNIAQIIVLLITGIVVAAAGGKFIPNPTTLSGSPPPAIAAALSIEAKSLVAPFTPTGTGFTYQGSLKSGGNPATGNYDFAFHLFDDPSVGSQVGTPVTITNQTVTAALFTVSLDFGPSAFDGNARYMEISVRQSGGGGYTTLSPRQPITPAPYALFALKTTPYKNVVVVALSGGQFTSITAALNSITDNSSTNRYLVYVAPGTYTETVTMKPWVDIEGAGEKATKITFTGSVNGNTGTVVGANNTELRLLTVVNTGANNYAIAIYNSGASPSLLHVTATASGGTTNEALENNASSSPNMINVTAIASGGFNDDGVVNDSSSPNMTNVIVTASGGSSINYAVNNNNSSSPTMTNVILTASGGSISIAVINNSSSPKILGSVLNASGGADNYGLNSYQSNQVTLDSSKITVPITGTTIYSYQSTTRVGASQVSGGSVYNAFGTLICSASYDGNKKRLGAQCTPDTKVVYVATTGGDFSSIQAALNSITDNSSTNRYLIRVAPGTYSEQVTMKPYVDIEGSGEKVTIITFTGSPSDNTGTVVGATNAELRSLYVVNTGGNAYAVAIYNNGASPSLLHIIVSATGATTTNYGVLNSSASPTMIDVTAVASGGATYNLGVYNLNSNSFPSMTNVTANAGGGTYNFGVQNLDAWPTIVGSDINASGGTGNYGIYNIGAAQVTIDNSKVTASTNTIYNNAGTTTRVGGSQLSGGPVFNAGTLTCSASYDENYISPGLNVCP